MIPRKRLGVTSDAGRRDQGGIYQCAGANHHAASAELPVTASNKSPIELALDSSARKADDGRPLRVGSLAAKPQNRRKLARSSNASARRTLRQVVPRRQHQRAKQRHGWPASFTFGRCRDARQKALPLVPVTNAATSSRANTVRAAGNP